MSHQGYKVDEIEESMLKNKEDWIAELIKNMNSMKLQLKEKEMVLQKEYEYDY
jgi:hypothetical protein